MHEEHIRRWFDDELAAIAHGIQRDAGRIEFDRIVALAITFVLPLLAAGVAAAVVFGVGLELSGARWWMALIGSGAIAIAALLAGLRRVLPPALTAETRVQERFHDAFARAVVMRLRPGWTYDAHSSLTSDELFASRLFQRLPLRRFTAQPRLRGLLRDMPFEMHEVVAIADGADPRRPRTVLTGFFAHVRLPDALPGHVRICRPLSDKTWRRPAMDGYRTLDVPALAGVYVVDATPDALHPAALPGLIAALADLAARGWLVHAAFGGLSAWVAIERARPWFEPRPRPAYAVGDVAQLEQTFAAIEQIAAQLTCSMSPVPAAPRRSPFRA